MDWGVGVGGWGGSCSDNEVLLLYTEAIIYSAAK